MQSAAVLEKRDSNIGPLLELKDVKVSFAGDGVVTEVLAGVTLRVGRGEFVAILGPSGSGKTTLFRLIGGLLTPDSGEIRLAGANLAGQRGRIGYMPQQPALLPWRRVLGNVALAAEVAGVAGTRVELLAREWLARAGLGGYEQAYPHELSGGMQQRASFVRALLGPQELLCLDEPFGALDALTRLEMQLWLASLWESSGRAVLLVTHSIEEALFLADRVYVLSQKPTSVLEEIRVPWPRPRREELLAAAEFGQLRQRIYSRMKGDAGA